MSEIIKTENLTFAYHDESGNAKFALNGIDLSIVRGEFVQK